MHLHSVNRGMEAEGAMLEEEHEGRTRTIRRNKRENIFKGNNFLFQFSRVRDALDIGDE